MAVTLDCGPCGERITAETEDELVRITQEHARRDHATELSRDDVLAMATPS